MKINVADALMHTTSSEETVVSAGFTDLSRAAGWPPLSRHTPISSSLDEFALLVVVGWTKNLHGTWATNVLKIE